MDTNQNTANNYQINTFTKGMNSDTSYDMIGADQYLFGQNIRITNNTLIFGDQHQNKTEGIVTPVYVGVKKPYNMLGNIILAAQSIEDIGVIITRDDDYYYVYKVIRKDGNLIISQDPIFKYKYAKEDNKLNSFSIVLHRETDEVLNLYIADGIHPVVQMNIENNSISQDVDYLISGRLLPTDRFMLEKTSGRLKTQQLQYTYRFYKKHGTTTKLAPLTNKFQVIDANRNKEQGNATDTRTSVGFKLTLKPEEKWKSNYDHLQIYRVSYIKANETPKVYLIYDDKFNGDVEYVDKGEDELQELSLDEFYALNTQIIVPQSIESNQGYLFAGNIKDETLLDLGDDVDTGSIELVQFDASLEGTFSLNRTMQNYFEEHGAIAEQTSYNDIFGSSLLRSLRSGEEYDYGVVYYNKYGARSNVYPISTINTTGKTVYRYENEQLIAMPIGVRYTPNIPEGYGIIGYQIVRRQKTEEYSNTILQVALSRPMHQGQYGDNKYRTPYYPNVYLTTQFLYIAYVMGEDGLDDGHGNIINLWNGYFDKAGTNVENNTLYQAFAPEINVRRTDTASNLKADSITLSAIRYVYTSETLEEVSGKFEYEEGGPTQILFFVTTKSGSDYPPYNALDYILGNYYDTDITREVEIGSISKSILIQEDNVFRNTILGGTTGYPYLIFFVRPGIQIQSVTVDGSPVTVQHGPVVKYKDESYVAYGLDRSGGMAFGDVVITMNNPGSGIHLISRHYPKDSNTSDIRWGVNERYNLYISIKYQQSHNKNVKPNISAVIREYEKNAINGSVDVLDIEDVKNPGWDQGFSNVQLGESGSADKIVSAMKQYKSFSSSVGSQQFVNWVANGMYNLATTRDEAHSQLGQNSPYGWVYDSNPEIWSYGWIGPGPVCLLLNTKVPAGETFNKQYDNFGTIVANITHKPISYNNQYTPYYGFGNYYNVKYQTDNEGQQHPIEVTVFDGDIYITPAEFVNMFKTYDFNDKEYSLISGQVVYYIPLESRINTFFDYGMNYRNTSSANLMLEPGEITGVASQARPLHQYNMIYSDNNTSIDVFTPHTHNDSETINHIPHRICYSQLKTDGENIDNWQIFKPVDFIDVDSKYGEITHLLTSDNTLYYWQKNAFGKLSVNERSLVKDENSNAIQLGTGGVLNRYDYLSTRYGMRPDDRAAIAAEHGIYWIDINNKAIPAFTGNGVVNYSELCNVQNLVNQKMANDIPTIDYDLQNYEVLCKINNEEQLIFNIKLNCSTAMYTRDYDRCLDIDNSLYGFRFDDELYYRKINYLTTEDDKELLSLVKIAFAVNPQSTLTKVYDNQKIVLMSEVAKTSRKEYPQLRQIDYPFLSNKTWEFNTDYQKSTRKPDAYRDTENNVWYAITRNGEFDDYIDPNTNKKVIGTTNHGDRLRGKWLKTEMTVENPEEFAISHFMTKFRQSYS